MTRVETSLRKRVAISTSSQVISQVINSILAVVILKIVTTSLGIHNYGFYATALVFVTTFSLLTDLGLNAITAREIARHPDQASDIIGHNIGLRIFLCIVMLPLILGLSFIFYPHQAAELHTAILFMSLYLLFDAICSVALAYFTSIVRNDIAAIVNTIQQIIFVLLVIGAAVLQLGLYGFIGAYVMSNACGALMAFYKTNRLIKVRPRLNLSKWKSILAMSISLGIIQLINMLYLKADSIMISIIKGTTAAGIYGIAYSLILAFLTLPSFIMTALLPSIATASTQNVRNIVEKAFQYMSILAWLLAFGSFAVRHDIIVLVANNHFQAAAAPFAILALASTFTYLNSVFGFASVALNKHRKLVYISLSSLLFNIGLNFILIPRYSINGAAWATVASEVLACIGVYIVFNKETGLRVRIISALLKPLAAGIVSLGVVHMIDLLVSARNPLLHLVITGLAVLFVYIATLLLLRGAPNELSDIIKRVKKAA